MPPKHESSPISPYDTANFFSLIFFSFISPIFRHARHCRLSFSNVFCLPSNSKSDTLFFRLRSANVFLQDSSQLTAFFLRRHRLAIILTGIIGLLRVALQTVQPYILFEFLSYLSDAATSGSRPLWHGIGLVATFFVVGVLYASCAACYGYICTSNGITLSGELLILLQQRLLSARVFGVKETSRGSVSAAVSSDLDPFLTIFSTIHESWLSILQFVVILAQLAALIQLPVLGAVGVCVLFGLLLPTLQTRIKTILQIAKQRADSRISALSECLDGIRAIKIFGWEAQYLKRIKVARMREFQILRILVNYRSLYGLEVSSIIPAVSVVVFVLYSHLSTFKVATAFACLSLINQLRQPVTSLPYVYSQINSYRVAWGRLCKVLSIQPVSTSGVVRRDLGDSIAVSFYNATVRYSGNEASAPSNGGFSLQNIDCVIPSGKLTAVIGEVGSGKSTFLLSILGELLVTDGELLRNSDSLAFAPQDYFIISGAVRDNILFGKNYDQAWYDQCVSECQLLHDFKQFKNGDLTLCGERGVDLSGGQKARICLARVVYAQKDINLFDDSLSAVDTAVSKKLFSQCIKALTARDKTVIFATHSLAYLRYCEFIVLLEAGKIVQKGSYESLLTESSGPFGALLKNSGVELGSEETDDIHEDLVAPNDENTGTDSKTTSKNESQTSHPQLVSSIQNTEKRKYPLMNVSTDSLGWPTYRYYLAALFKQISFPLIIACGCLTAQGFNILTTLWISWWSSDQFSKSNEFYNVGYVLVSMLQVFFMFISQLGIAILAQSAAQNIHQKCLQSMFKAQLAYFESIPTGRVLNFFLGDQKQFDDFLSGSLGSIVMQSLTLISFTVTIAIIFPYLLVLFFVAGVFFVKFYSAYSTSVTQFRRILPQKKAEMLENVLAQLSGTPCIRALGAENVFTQRHFERRNNMHATNKMLLSLNLWFTERINLISYTCTSVVALGLLLAGDSVNVALAGSLLVFSMQMTDYLIGLMFTFGQVENSMNSVERAKAVEEDMPHEDISIGLVGTERLAMPDYIQNWPKFGNVEFADVWFRYSTSSPFVLKGVSISINAGERVGIVGRTGAGKSTFLSVLLRLRDISAGMVRIDDVDVSNVPLTWLRSRMAVVTQDPVIYSGTARDNLDPFRLHQDSQLIAALEKAHFFRTLHKKFGGLSGRLGHSMSNGEKAQIGLARALVKNSKVLLIDEATASVDLVTDVKIQRSLKSLGGCTILSIAHRLHTIIDYNRIVVMSAGVISELDSPARLMANSQSSFRAMVMELGIDVFKNLEKIALASEEGADIDETQLIGLIFSREKENNEASPLSPHQLQIVSILSQISDCSVQDIMLSSTFASLGLSLREVEAFADQISSAFGLSSLSTSQLLACETTEAVCEFIREQELLQGALEIQDDFMGDIDGVGEDDSFENIKSMGEVHPLKGALGDRLNILAFDSLRPTAFSVVQLMLLIANILLMLGIIVSCILISNLFLLAEAVSNSNNNLGWQYWIAAVIFIIAFVFLSILYIALLSVLLHSFNTKGLEGLHRFGGGFHLGYWIFSINWRFARQFLAPLSGTEYLNFILRLLGSRIGHDCHIYSCQIDLPFLVSIGNCVFSSHRVAFQAVQFVHSHCDWEQQPLLDSRFFLVQRILIGDFVSICERTVLTGGAQVGSRCFIETLSFVDSKVPSGCVYQGRSVQEAAVSSQTAKGLKSRGKAEMAFSFIAPFVFLFVLLFPIGTLFWALVQIADLSLPFSLAIISFCSIPLLGLSATILSVLYVLSMRNARQRLLSGHSCRIGSFMFFQYLWLHHHILSFSEPFLTLVSDTAVVWKILQLLGLNLTASGKGLIRIGRVHYGIPMSMIQINLVNASLFLSDQCSIGSLRVTMNLFETNLIELSATHSSIVIMEKSVVESSIQEGVYISQLTALRPKTVIPSKVKAPAGTDSSSAMLVGSSDLTCYPINQPEEDDEALEFIGPAGKPILIIRPSSADLTNHHPELFHTFSLFLSQCSLAGLALAIALLMGSIIAVFDGSFLTRIVLLSASSMVAASIGLLVVAMMLYRIGMESVFGCRIVFAKVNSIRQSIVLSSHRLYTLWNFVFGRFCLQSLLSNLVLRGFGMDISLDCFVNELQFSLDHAFVCVASGCVIGEGAIISCRRPKTCTASTVPFVGPSYFEIRTANLSSQVILATDCCVSAPSSVSKSIELKPLTGVLPFSEVERPQQSALQGNLPQAELGTLEIHLRSQVIAAPKKGRKSSVLELL